MRSRGLAPICQTGRRQSILLSIHRICESVQTKALIWGKKQLSSSQGLQKKDRRGESAECSWAPSFLCPGLATKVNLRLPLSAAAAAAAAAAARDPQGPPNNNTAYGRKGRRHYSLQLSSLSRLLHEKERRRREGENPHILPAAVKGK